MCNKIRQMFVYNIIAIALIVRSKQCESFSLEKENPSCGDDDQFLIDEFKGYTEMVITKNFMKSDLYVLRWLNAYNCDVNLAVEKFQKCLEWRNKNNIDTILLEDFTKFEAQVSFGMEGFDRDGRPIGWGSGGRLDLRKIALSGEVSKFERMLFRNLELFETIIYEKGNNISQGIVLVDISGFSVKKVGCFQCLELLPDVLIQFEECYPMLFYKAYFFNAPKLFDTTMSFMKNFLSEPSKRIIQVFDYDKEKWSSALLKQINKEELSEEYGGTKSNVIDGKSYSPSKARMALFNKYLEAQRDLLVQKQEANESRPSSKVWMKYSSESDSSTSRDNSITKNDLNLNLSDYNKNESYLNVDAKAEHHHHHRHHHIKKSSNNPNCQFNNAYKFKCASLIMLNLYFILLF